MTKACLWDRCCASLWCKVSPLIGMNVCVCISDTPLQPPPKPPSQLWSTHSWLDRPNNRQYPLLSSLCSCQLWMDLVSKSWQGSAMPERRGEWGNKCLLRIAQEIQNSPCDVLSPERRMKTGTHICYPNVNSGHLVLSRRRGNGVVAGLRPSSGEAWVLSSGKWYSGGKKQKKLIK